MKSKPTLLFLCTGNSCRSQMAEGWAKKLKSDVFEIYSAGVETHGLNPQAVRVMKEAGVDISGQKSQHIDEFKDIKLDWLVTVCDHAKESCPVLPGQSESFHISFPDPPRLAKDIAATGGSEEDQLDCYRSVRDQIRDFVQELPKKLTER